MDRPAPGFPAVLRLGEEDAIPSAAGQAKAEQTGPGPSSQARLTGQARPAPLRVADGDGMDRHHPWRARAQKAPEMRVNNEEKENGFNGID